MGKPHPLELRLRIVAFVDEGNTHRAAARHFRTSPKFVNDMVKLRRETGALILRPLTRDGLAIVTSVYWDLGDPEDGYRP